MTKIILQHGGYKKLLSYRKAEVIFDGTHYFCSKYLRKGDRTIDQMIQAARSGKQNIVEASMASGTSKETEIKLTNVARASLEELLVDYEDYARINKIDIWDTNHPYYRRLRELHKQGNEYSNFSRAIEHESVEICVNTMIDMIKVTSYLLDKQLITLENNFVQQGGIRERMTQARTQWRSNNSSLSSSSSQSSENERK